MRQHLNYERKYLLIFIALFRVRDMQVQLPCTKDALYLQLSELEGLVFGAFSKVGNFINNPTF